MDYTEAVKVIREIDDNLQAIFDSRPKEPNIKYAMDNASKDLAEHVNEIFWDNVRKEQPDRKYSQSDISKGIILYKDLFPYFNEHGWEQELEFNETRTQAMASSMGETHEPMTGFFGIYLHDTQGYLDFGHNTVETLNEKLNHLLVASTFLDDLGAIDSNEQEALKELMDRDYEAAIYFIKYLQDQGDDGAYDYHNSHVIAAIESIIAYLEDNK